MEANDTAVSSTGAGIFFPLFAFLFFSLRVASQSSHEICQEFADADGGLTPAPDVPAQAATGGIG